jgi:hypothetical protein
MAARQMRHRKGGSPEVSTFERAPSVIRLPVVALHVIEKRAHGGAREAAAGIV